MMTALRVANMGDAHSHSFWDALPHLAGMILVLMTLIFLWGVCVILSKLVQIRFNTNQTEKKRPTTPPMATTTTPSTSTSAVAASSTPSPEIVAVIAAAVATVAGKSSRIVSILPLDTSWERSGRLSIFSSHRIR